MCLALFASYVLLVWQMYSCMIYVLGVKNSYLCMTLLVSFKLYPFNVFRRERIPFFCPELNRKVRRQKHRLHMVPSILIWIIGTFLFHFLLLFLLIFCFFSFISSSFLLFHDLLLFSVSSSVHLCFLFCFLFLVSTFQWLQDYILFGAVVYYCGTIT